MTKAERVGVVFIILMTAALIYPGLTLANRIFPLVLGLPFVLFWAMAWVAASAGIFYVMHRSRRS